MVPVKMNMKSNQKFASDLWKWDDCFSMDSQAHVLWCLAYAPLREGKNLEDNMDIVHYYKAVMKIREDHGK